MYLLLYLNMIFGVCIMTNKQEFMKTLEQKISPIFIDTHYSIKINMTDGDGYKMIDIFKNGESKRCAFIETSVKNNNYSISVQKIYVPRLNMEMNMPKPGEIKAGRYPNWVRYRDVSYDTVVDFCNNIVKCF